MKITDVKAHHMSIPRPQPSWTAHEITTEATLILVEVRTDAGVIGYGEIQGGPLPLICRLVEQFGEIIRGMDALAHLDIWEKLFALTSPRPGGIGGRDGLPPPLPRGQRLWSALIPSPHYKRVRSHSADTEQGAKQR